MTGGEIVPASKAAIAAAKAAFGERPAVEQQLAELAKDHPAMQEAAAAYAARVAVKQKFLLKLYQPLAKWAGASREYFENDFATDMAKKIADIPDEHLATPKPSVAVPAMQGLGYSLDEPDLKEMYLTLIATATDERTSKRAHPSFAEIIRQLTGGEARLLTNVLRTGTLPIVQVRHKARTTEGGTLVANHVLKLVAIETDMPFADESIAAWVDNWVRLGLVEADYLRYLVAPNAYEWVDQRPEVLQIVAKDDRGQGAVDIVKGMLRTTDFGERFASAVTPT